MHIVSRQPSETKRSRMAPLDVLPVFFNLKGKRVLVAGGDDPAVWKAELLAAAGASVTVHAPRPGPDMTALATQGTITLAATPWRSAEWSDLALAIGDCDDDEANDFVAMAKAHGVPVNVIDKPEHCQFQFGGIVNRSPLVIGISTNGAAPILGQAVRRRIETLLPDSIAAWARLARTLRGKILDALAPGAERRAFWERFSELSFGGTPPAIDADTLIAVARQAKSGRVTLVGAGPGDAEYLTIKAVRALQSADVILFDDLVSAEVLDLARREAKRILVGKRGQRESCKQDDINALMVKLAKSGKHVARLKSGDPMIFGRAGEELEFLHRHNVPADVIPGVSTAFALASIAGISLTHRDFAQSVRFVTGHSRNGQLPDTLDWQALADPATTHVWYMPRGKLGEIQSHLLDYGMPEDTPVLLANSVARPNQQLFKGTLGELLLLSRRMINPTEPSILMVGTVLRSKTRSSLDLCNPAIEARKSKGICFLG